jgi:5'-nucleotidase
MFSSSSLLSPSASSSSSTLFNRRGNNKNYSNSLPLSLRQRLLKNYSSSYFNAKGKNTNPVYEYDKLVLSRLRSSNSDIINNNKNKNSSKRLKHTTHMSKLRALREEADEVALDSSKSDERSSIFCNRSLPMRSIRSVGFDMDYTLACYKPETFERLVYRKTIEKLVNVLKYPKEILKYEFDENYMVRGLIIDKRRGNVLKCDRHNYVKVAMHGFRAISTDERLSTYCDSSKVGTTFDGREYAAMDTLFALAEAYLFCQIVDLKDKYHAAEKNNTSNNDDDDEGDKNRLREVSYHEIYDEIRKSVDLVHRDGSLKHEVAKDPQKYIIQDDTLKELLSTLKMSNRSVFLLTNSLFDYTNVVMNYLLSGNVGEKKTLEWMDYFDVVFVGSQKPNFFSQDNNTIFEVDPKTYHLKNTDSGAPLTPIGGENNNDATNPTGLFNAKVYQGGSYVHLHDALDISRGSDILYVGDHIFGDILRSKKQIGWRTMLIVPELSHELDVLQDCRKGGFLDELKDLREQRDALDEQRQRLAFQKRIKKLNDDDRKLDKKLEKTYGEVRDKHRQRTREYHEKFHYVWGALLKSGCQNSRFAHQVERYACVYTSKVSNILKYSPEVNYRAFSDSMPHDA